jgi:hypothetical protein
MERERSRLLVRAGGSSLEKRRTFELSRFRYIRGQRGNSGPADAF